MFRLYELKEGLRIAFTAIRLNKMRSVLTTLGIIIGIVTVTLMATAIEGLDRSLNKSIEALGSDVIYVSTWDWFGGEWWKMRNRRDITMEQFHKLRDRLTLARAVVPVADAWMRTFKYGNRYVKGNVNGTNADYLITSGVVPRDGRFFNQLESDAGREVAVLGADVARVLFEREDPIGKTIKVDGHPFRVIGVLEKAGEFLGSSFFSSDSQVFIPIEVFFKIFGETHRSIDINIKVDDPKQKEDARIEIVGAFRQIRRVPFDKENDFGINEADFLKNIFNTIVGVIGTIGFVITSLSLLVGGVGIMNIMFVSVKERTREIGIRKAIGAKRRTILLQFLIEAATLCLIGGVIGLAISFPLSLLIDQFLPTAMPIWVVGLSIGLALLVGVVAGITPAYTAAKMDPVEALRYE